MDIIREIEEYTPYNEQERKDKELMLWFLKSNPNAFDRENTIAHMTASCFIVDPAMEKTLFCFHRIYQSWSWLGGHADGDKDLLKVALKEAREESGLTHIRPYDSKIFSIESLCVNGHVKRGHYVSSHLHFNVTYLLVADMNETLHIKEDENSSLRWFALDDILKASSEPWFVEHIYPKLIEKTKQIRKHLHK